MLKSSQHMQGERRDSRLKNELYVLETVKNLTE
jgi:hypothetical protein